MDGSREDDKVLGDRVAKEIDQLDDELGIGAPEAQLDDDPVFAAGSQDDSGPNMSAEEAAAFELFQAAEALPRVEAVLEKSGLSTEHKEAWLTYLRTLGLPEEELLEILATEEEVALATTSGPKGLSTPSRTYVPKHLTVFRHEMSRWWNGANPLLRIIYAAAWMTILLGPVFQVGWTWWTIPSVIIAVAVKGRLVFNENHPKHMQLLRRGYDQRKVLFRKLLHQQQLWSFERPSRREIEGFQHEALELIALFMRDHRSDVKGKTIFANLMVQRDEQVEVVARSERNRPVLQRYTKDQCKLVWDAIQDGRPQMTGDLYTEFPNSTDGKKYNSVLVLPVQFDGRVLGAVSIDSESRYHFDRYFEELDTGLAPYVQLLAVTLSDAYVKSAPDEPALGAGEQEHDAGNA